MAYKQIPAAMTSCGAPVLSSICASFSLRCPSAPALWACLATDIFGALGRIQSPNGKSLSGATWASLLREGRLRQLERPGQAAKLTSGSVFRASALSF